MYQVLLVDDEHYALEGLKSGVDWDKFAIDQIHLAYNIRQAKEIIERHPVDFLICDIEMPEGSGIELLVWVREHYPEKEWIYLTCHVDFGYAQQAVQLGSLDYLLKPVRYGELENVIRKALDKVDKRRQEHAFKQNYDHYYGLWKMHQPLIVERFWLDLLGRTLSASPADIQSELLQRSISYHEQERFVPVLIVVQRWHRKLSPRDEKIMEYAMRNAAAHSLIPGNDMGQVVPLQGGGMLLALLPLEHNEQTGGAGWRGTCRAFIRFCNQHMYCDISCYVGMPARFHEMIGMVEKLHVLHQSNVSAVNAELLVEDGPGKQMAAREAKDSELPAMNEWTELLKLGEREKLLTRIRAFLQRVQTEERGNAKLLHYFYHDFIQMLYHVLQLKGLKAREIFSEHIAPERAASLTRSVFELNEWAEHMIEIALASMDEREESQTVLDKVMRYVAENIDQPLTRKDIANHVYLNQDYLAKLFKKQTGHNLSDYVVGERMKRARSMLENSGMSIGDVAVAVGYSSFSYFSKTFKGKFGMTPQEFRADGGKISDYLQ
ncbi:response regulator transcription factor [Paenibacillus thalictri]|uniref:Helix-turn-helix domain-containing protein n=1 Tax=Paenibacillus thalictri TaxID=2527873 RepID=A0A4Q9DF62_9BACL|nr:helix-turn-helix domain-containing protein [Paenibacillus thalictri]TBL68291.1 helix-turn-helix domain-containing protein [Paenibacillus thalictri]